jgi:hypothetical protein
MEKLTGNLQSKIQDSEKNVDLMRNLLENSEKRGLVFLLILSSDTKK